MSTAVIGRQTSGTIKGSTLSRRRGETLPKASRPTGKGKVALVAGAGGIIGHAVAHELMNLGWSVRGLGRRSVPGIPSIAADLTDPKATAAALAGAKDTTHVFYAALSPDPHLSTEAERNAAMLAALLDGLKKAKAPLERVVIYQGFKIYGIHLGARVRTPARESDPAAYAPEHLSRAGATASGTR